MKMLLIDLQCTSQIQCQLVIALDGNTVIFPAVSLLAAEARHASVGV